MSTFEKAWEAAGNDDELIDPEDGAYLARLTDARAFSAKSDGKNYVKLEWELLEGPNVGGRFEDFGGIDHPVRMRITKSKLTMLGLPPEPVKTIEDLHEAIGRLIGVEATVSIEHNGNFVNVDVLMAKTGEPDVPIDMPTDNGLSDEEKDFADTLGDDDEEPMF